MSVPALPRVPDSAEVKQELEQILASAVFRGSKRCQDFLRYVSTKSLEGEAGTLKERTLATEVFGRSGASDLGDDSIVRVGAREVRKRLAQYYVTDGAQDKVRIELPAGSYVPVFHYHGAEVGLSPVVMAPIEETVRSVVADEGGGSGRRFRRVIPLALGAVAMALVAVATLRFLGREVDPFQTFWRPVLHAGAPVMIVLPHPIVYHPSAHASSLDSELHEDSRLPTQRAIDVPPQLLNGSDFIPVLDQYIGFGDALAAMRLTTLLEHDSRVPKFRLASRVEFTDLRDSIPILLGAYTNRWTIETTRNMRFRFVMKRGRPGILDAKDNHVWSLEKQNDGRSTEDYVLICRLPHAETGDFMMIGAGINMSGTEEAGRILADQRRLDSILQQLPKGWETSNLQLVLHVEVIGDAPAMPQVVARQIWK